MTATTRTAPDPAPPMPRNPEAERNILGAILLDSSVMPALAQLRVVDFFELEYQIIYGAMLGLAAKQQPIDTVTLYEALAHNEKINALGGAAYLSELPKGLPRVSNTAHYARIVKEKSVLREMMHWTENLGKAAAANEDPAMILEQADAKLATLRTSLATSGEPRGWEEAFHSIAEIEATTDMGFLIEGFLPKQACTIIGGLSGHSKTFLAMSICKAVLAGKGTRLWDTFPVRENVFRVVYLIPESTLAPFKYRLEKMGLMDAVRDSRLFVRTLSKGPALDLKDPRLLYAVKNAVVVLDTAARFFDGDENSASEIAQGFTTDVFGLLAAGATAVLILHHSPKGFGTAQVATLENVLRGTGDIGAMVGSAWAVRQIDAQANVVHVENVKARDYDPSKPFQLVGRPFIDAEGDFRLHKAPGECGSLAEELPDLNPQNRKGGASETVREAKAANLALLRVWLQENPRITSTELVAKFHAEGIEVSDSTIRHYRRHVEG
jgi:DnaB-like helicase N terminal domain/AAA domain